MATDITYDQAQLVDDQWRAIAGATWGAQGFTPSLTHVITHIRLKGRRVGSIGTITVALRTSSGELPFGNDVASGTYDGDTLTTAAAGETFVVVLTPALVYTVGVKFTIIIRAPNATGGNQLELAENLNPLASGDPYTGGKESSSPDSGSSWNLIAGEGTVNYFDFYFAEGVGPSLGMYQTEVDWNNDGDFSDANEDLTFIDALSGGGHKMVWERGIETELDRVGTGTLELVVKNADGKYSPENAASALYPNVLPGRPIRIRAVNDGVIYDLFKGRIEKFVPHPGHDEETCDILATDGSDQLNAVEISSPAIGAVTAVKMGQATQVTGVNITFANANPDTITRASGSFVDDGFQATMRVRVAGSASNNGTYRIATVAALVLTLHADEALAAEGPVAGVTLTGYGPVGIVLDEANWAAADRVLDAGVDNLDQWGAERVKALFAIQQLMGAERALAYVDEQGRLVYEDRHHRLKGAHLTSQATFSDTMRRLDYEVSTRSVRNRARVSGRKWTVTTTDLTWGTRDRPRVPNGGAAQQIDVWVNLDNPVSQITAPVSTTDWKANSDSSGLGADLTANVTVTATLVGTRAVRLRIVNSGTQPAYIVPGDVGSPDTLIFKYREYDRDDVLAVYEDATSRTAYGDRSIEVDTVFKGAWNDLYSYATWLVSRYKGVNAAGTLVPVPDAVRMQLTNSSSALLVQILTRKISDRITVTNTKLGITAKDYFINKMRHEVSDGGLVHDVTWWLERVDETKYWVLGQAGYSELGQTTTLVF